MMLKVDFFEQSFILWSNEKITQPDTVFWPEINGKIETGALRNELSHFVNCVLYKKCSIIASNDDALYTMKIADAVVKSSLNGKEIKLDD